MPVRLPRNAQIWFPGYLKTLLSARPKPRHVWVMIGDHYEPMWGKPAMEVALERVRLWRSRWPEIASRYADSEGRPPQYTFFYPEEEYHPALLTPLAEMTHAGIADVEIHLHHNGEGEADFIRRISGFKQKLFEGHGLLRRVDGDVVFAFIHGNWALDNSLPSGRLCGLNNEITLLKQLGCYADFTLPSAPSPAQTTIVNQIYWATDDPAQPKSHDRGIPVRIGGGRDGDLLMIQGPLGLRFGEAGRWKVRLESGELAGQDLPTESRVRVWFQVAPQLGDHCFIKLFAHGTQERNSGPLLNGGLDELYRLLLNQARADGCRIHFASAWQMYSAIESLRTGREPDATNGSPNGR